MKRVSNQKVITMNPLLNGSSVLKTSPTKAGPPPYLENETIPSIIVPEARILITDDGDDEEAAWSPTKIRLAERPYALFPPGWRDWA